MGFGELLFGFHTFLWWQKLQNPQTSSLVQRFNNKVRNMGRGSDSDGWLRNPQKSEAFNYVPRVFLFI